MDDRHTPLTLGTAGHIDHGKTALLKALTGIDADRLKEEKERGITTDIGFAPWLCPPYRIGFIDVPGHERFVANMLAGAGGMDGIVLVVAADEGVMPQTREHFDIARLLGIRTGIVVLTKCDLADEEMVEVVEEEVRELVAGSFLEGSPVIRFSAVSGQGLEGLRHALRGLADRAVGHCASGIPRLFIDRVFTLRGHGAVVTGTVRGSAFRRNDAIVLQPGNLAGKVRGCHIHGEEAEEAPPGSRAALNLAGPDHHDLRRGMVVTLPGTLRPSAHLLAAVSLLGNFPRRLPSGVSVHVHLGTSESVGRVHFLGRESLAPGESGYARLFLEAPLAAFPGDRFVFRQYSPLLTMGGGTVLENHPELLKRRNVPTLRKELPALEAGGDAHLLHHLLEHAISGALDREEIPAQSGLGPALVQRILEEGEARGTTCAVSPDRTVWSLATRRAEVEQSVLSALERFLLNDPALVAMGKEELLGKFPGVSSLLLKTAVETLAISGRIGLAGEKVTLPGRAETLRDRFAEPARLVSDALSAAGPAGQDRSQLLELLSSAGSSGPVEVLDYLLEAGEAVRIADDLYLHPEALSTVLDILRDRFGTGIFFETGTVRDLLGIGRKQTISILEYLDRRGFTARAGNQRRLRQIV